VKIAVYDRYWSTAGGGEKYAGGVASVLAEDHDVTLLSHEPIDLDWLGERLALDLSQVTVEEIGDAGRVEDASEAYDLLINLSYHSSDRCGARRGIYVVHFPHSQALGLPPRQRALLERFGPIFGGRSTAWWPGPGFFPPDVVRLWRVRWTDGNGELAVPLAPGQRAKVHLLLGSMLPAGLTIDARIEVDGRPAGTVRVGSQDRPTDAILPRRIAVNVRGRDDGTPVSIHIRSDTWIPAEHGIGADTRGLGVPLVGVAVGSRPLALGRAVASLFETYPYHLTLSFLDSYDRVLANSAFTRRWVRLWWDRDSDVLYPPVSLRPAAPEAKGPVILSVGRFFEADRGHSKKQLEMVRAWRQLLEVPAARAIIDDEGWRLHLVGGCSADDRPYLDAVLAEAEGLPVDVHVDASGAELDALYRQASIYWHAAGLGEDEEANPDRMEHFGITTVEAMSAGAVPVAFAAAGPLEAFRDGVEGHHFRTIEELVRSTAGLLSEPDRRATMAAAATERARHFGPDAFARRLRAHVADVTR
jgi:glycosyltransferase involved in cell wall biosynthesis